MPTPFKIYLGGLIALIPLTLLIGFFSPDAAFAVGWGGTLLWMTGFMFFIIFFDSKKRWPSSSPFDRFARLVTFDSSSERRSRG